MRFASSLRKTPAADSVRRAGPVGARGKSDTAAAVAAARKDAALAFATAAGAGAARPYSPEWDVERAVTHALLRVVWVMRAVNAIATNQAKLPVILRNDVWDDSSIDQSHPLVDLLNVRPNPYEDAFLFRKRLSAQLLLSKNGAFIEVVTSNAGDVTELYLLPVARTEPIPNPKTFVSGYKVRSPDYRSTKDRVLRPDQVIWVRDPHPVDPYGAITPLEAAGVAVETDWFAKIYERNFLKNDGLSAGILAFAEEMDDEDVDELEAMLSGGPERAGKVAILDAAEKLQYIKTGAAPDASRSAELRAAARDEIFGALGVPLTVGLGNAAGRTFDNADAEKEVFWEETMDTHLRLISSALQVLTPGKYPGFDVSRVPVLQKARIARQRFYLEELRVGAITYDEYRELTGREPKGIDYLMIPTKLSPADSNAADPDQVPSADPEPPAPDAPETDDTPPEEEPLPPVE